MKYIEMDCKMDMMKDSEIDCKVNMTRDIEMDYKMDMVKNSEMDYRMETLGENILGTVTHQLVDSVMDARPESGITDMTW